jgi:hypothetical protein
MSAKDGVDVARTVYGWFIPAHARSKIYPSPEKEMGLVMYFLGCRIIP